MKGFYEKSIEYDFIAAFYQKVLIYQKVIHNHDSKWTKKDWTKGYLIVLVDGFESVFVIGLCGEGSKRDFFMDVRCSVWFVDR